MYILGKLNRKMKRKRQPMRMVTTYEGPPFLFLQRRRPRWKHRQQSGPSTELQTLPFVEYVEKVDEKQKLCGWGAHMSVILGEWSRHVSTGSMHYASESQWHLRPQSAELVGNAPSTLLVWKQIHKKKKKWNLYFFLFLIYLFQFVYTPTFSHLLLSGTPLGIHILVLLFFAS